MIIFDVKFDFPVKICFFRSRWNDFLVDFGILTWKNIWNKNFFDVENVF